MAPGPSVTSLSMPTPNCLAINQQELGSVSNSCSLEHGLVLLKVRRRVVKPCQLTAKVPASAPPHGKALCLLLRISHGPASLKPKTSSQFHNVREMLCILFLRGEGSSRGSQDVLPAAATGVGLLPPPKVPAVECYRSLE